VLHAQLITDSDSRLKTEKSDVKGFLFFSKKKKTPRSAAPAGQQSHSFTEARFSPSSPFKANRRTANVRFKSADRSSLFRNKVVSPRYSKARPYSFKLASTPRFSTGSPFTKRDVVVNPRYSSGSPFSSRNLAVVPRYSPDGSRSKFDKVVSPRYSSNKIWSKQDLAIHSPKYSSGSPWRNGDHQVNPRYSTGNPFRGINWVVKPDFSTYKHRFDQNKQMKKENAIFNFESGQWKGVRPGRFNKEQSMHPSIAYTNSLAFNFKSEDMLRKLNLFWSRLDGNKVQPPSVKEKVQKPKFDRKETNIWND